MTPEQFCYWLQGRIELLPDQVPSPQEWASIREHLGAVFHKVTPPVQPTITWPNRVKEEHFPPDPFPSYPGGPGWAPIVSCSASGMSNPRDEITGSSGKTVYCTQLDNAVN